jgi:3-(3-hydroxy-phenyl)propionate hydroxylase
MSNFSAIPVWKQKTATPKPEISAEDSASIVVVGAGPIGLAMALDLGVRGHEVIVLTRFPFVPGGSKAICFSKRTLEIFDRLGVGDAVVEKGVNWNTGKVFRGASEQPIFQFDLLPVKDQKRPAFINIQQYYVENVLVEALETLPNVTIRWGHEVTGLTNADKLVELVIAANDGSYKQSAKWVIACDGSRSSVRNLLGLDFLGREFEETFLIADIRMETQFPAERWFWFDPPFNPGQSALLHKQPDNIWRLDFQLGWNIDRDACLQEEYVSGLIRKMLGPDIDFSIEWLSIYTFQCRRMARFLHGNIVFAGDSAHLVSPFGARGCNGGIADVDNLGWKLDLIMRGLAPTSLLESYNDEAITTADVNLLNSTRATDFLTPKSEISRAFRDAVLELAAEYQFARPLVNSGRLSMPVAYPNSQINTPDMENWDGGIPPGTAAIDAPLGDGWLLNSLGQHFCLLADSWTQAAPIGLRLINLSDFSNDHTILRERYCVPPGGAYLFRPDQYVAARWQKPTAELIAHAIQKATGQ